MLRDSFSRTKQESCSNAEVWEPSIVRVLDAIEGVLAVVEMLATMRQI